MYGMSTWCVCVCGGGGLGVKEAVTLNTLLLSYGLLVATSEN